MNKYKIAEYLVTRTPSYSKLKYSVENLNIYLDDKYFLNAIELASPVFYGIIKNKINDGQALTKKENLTLKKYINRIHFRSTPFGLFSYVGISAWQKTTQNNDLRPEKEMLVAFHKHDQEEKEKKPTYFTNKSIYKVDKELRYLKREPDKNEILDWKIYSIRSSNLLRKLVTYCTDGKTQAQAIQYVKEHQEVSIAEASDFIDELIKIQLLYPENLQGPVKKSILSKQNTIVIEQKNVTDKLIQKGHTISSLGYVNLFNENTEYLDNQHITLIHEAINCLRALCPQKEIHRLNKYKRKFVQKYDRKPVQLLQSLDPEIGIAYIESASNDSLNSVIKDVHFGQSNSTVTSIDWGKSHRLLLRKIQQVGQSKTLEISDKDLLDILPKERSKSLSSSLSVVFMINHENKIIIENIGGASALSLLGRFTENPKIDALVKDIAKTEVSINDDVIFAEINSLVSNKYLNINQRNNPYIYEICIGIPCNHENQIPLNDLYIFYVQNDLILYSKTLKKRIIPRLSSAYNYDIDSLPAFQFLCDLQYQGLNYDLNIGLHDFFPGLSFYPRIIHKEIILQLAIWFFEGDALRMLKNADHKNSIKLVDEYFSLNHIPQKIALIEHDKFLVFNLDKLEEKDFFIECIKGMDKVKIREHPYDTSNFHQQSKQFIASIINLEKIYSNIPFPMARPKKINDHILPNDWLYLKIYCHPKRSEELLYKIEEIIKILFEQKELQQWFYINYNDPEYHLRIRLKLDKGIITSHVQKQINFFYSLHLKGYIHRIGIDTYQPEYERYGVKLMHYAETLFFRDSEYCLSLIKERQISEIDYFHKVLLSVHEIFESLEINIQDRKMLLKSLAEYMISELEISKYELDKSYRKHANDIGMILSLVPQQTTHHIYKERFNAALKEYTEKIKKQEVLEKLSDILHMHINRLFITTAKIHETTIYYWLYKYYTSLSKKIHHVKNIQIKE